jgi:hypothetical protein
MSGQPRRNRPSKIDEWEPERRRARRWGYDAVVRIENERVRGRDISVLGLAVETTHPTQVGDVVRVTLSPGSPDGVLDEIGAAARVVRLEPGIRGDRVGLQFIQV